MAHMSPPVQDKVPTPNRPPEGVGIGDLVPGSAADDITAHVDQSPGFPVIGIGASAGGLSAFKKFFSKMPVDSGAAFVLVPHLDPKHESLMVDLLSRQTKMPVSEARDGQVIQPNCVYIIPPTRDLTIVDRKLRLSDPAERHGSSTAIDLFLESLARDQQERAVGIILSGTSSHGTVGLKEIKLAGGMVMVQQPQSAEYDQMPLSAIATGVVDFVLPPEEMPETLVKYLQHPYVAGGNRPVADESATELLTRVLALLKTRTKYDFHNYRKNMLLRRVHRRMGLCHITQLADYISYLRGHAEEADALYKDLLIGVTQFFRDAEAFEVLQQRVIPELVSRCVERSDTEQGNATPVASEARRVRVWVPACASGEEAYSIAMLLIERFTAEGRTPQIQIFASDIDERSLGKARLGTYSDNILTEVSPERLQRFFTKSDTHHWQVTKPLRDSITFAAQNLISDAPFTKLDLISCRNLLIYLEPAVQAKVIRLFHFALAEGGYLLLGPSESISGEVDLFEPVSKKWRLFRRMNTPRRPAVEVPIIPSEDRLQGRRSLQRPTPTPTIGFKELIQRLVLDDFAPASALINANHEIINLIGPLVNYLEFPAGDITHDLLALARTGLRTKIRAAVHKASETGSVVLDRDARVKRDGAYVPCTIRVKPVTEPKDAAGLFLVTFQDRTSTAGPAVAETVTCSTDEDQSQLIRHLEQELKAAREDLQNSVEDYESSTEELKASNEEVMSMNEELQSANEELETSKEELQSLNEELTTVNSQLQDKVEELDRSHSDLTNLMTSSEVATIFLDTQLRIKRFTPPVAKLLNLRPSDIDRPMSDLAPKFNDSVLLANCQEVLDKLVPMEKVVVDSSPATPPQRTHAVRDHVKGTAQNSKETLADETRHRCYLRRILPYRTTSNLIDGVVINYIDITQRMAGEAESRRLAAVLRDSNDAVTVHDFDGQILAWNRGAEQMYGYREADALKMNIRDLVPEELRTEALAYAARLARGESVQAFETQRRTKDGRVLDVEVTITAYRDEHGQPACVATTERDVTDRKLLTQNLAQLNATLEQRVADQTREVRLLAEAVSHLGEGVIITSDDLDWPGPQIIFVNDAMCRISGYDAHELLGKTPRILQGAQTDRKLLEWIKQELSAKKSCSIEVVNYRKDGTPYDADLFITPLFNAENRRTNFVSIQRDITARKRSDEELRQSEERMRAVLNTAFDAIILIDQSGRIVSANPATERLFGYANDELLGQNVSMLMPPPYRGDHDSYIAHYLQTGEARIIGSGREVVALRKDGSTFPIDLAVSQVDHTGLFAGIIRDISLRKELQKQVLKIAEDEQRRIGQELHDGTGQELTGLSLFAGTLVDILNRAPEKVPTSQHDWIITAANLSRLRETATRLSSNLVIANQHVQQLCHGIMPVQVEVEGLRSALEQLASTTNELQQISCRFKSFSSIAVANNTVATHLYRIAQEAVNNALKHSRATEIEISLLTSHGDLVLKVTDNGVGFDPTALTRPTEPGRAHGFGLEIMNYRAGIIGGQLHISRRDAGGMLVRCVVPSQGKTP